MASYRKFTGSSEGDIFKFTKPGTTIEGEFVRVHDGKFGPLLVLKVDGEDVTCAVNTGLLNCFDEAFGSIKKVPQGTRLFIEFKEFVPTKAGGTFKRFELGVDESQIANTVPADEDDGSY